MDREALKKDLSSVLNKHSIDNSLDTPDFILADYLIDTLLANIQMKVETLKFEVKQDEDTT